MLIAGDSPRPDSVPPGRVDESKVTVAQLLAAWGTFAAHGGTYTISGDTVTVKALISKTPRVMERSEYIVFSFKIEGDKLTLITVRDANGPMANPTITTLTRVE